MRSSFVRGVISQSPRGALHLLSEERAEQLRTAMFYGKFHCIKAINVRKKNIVQMRPLTAEIKNNN